MKRTFPLHIHISILFLSLILLVGGSIGSIGYKLSRDMLETMVSGLTDRISRETFSELQRSIAPAEMATNVLSHDALIESRSLPERLRRLSFMRKMLDSSALVSSLYVGYASGDFFYIRRVHNDKERDNFKAPHATRYIVQSIEHAAGGVRGRYVFIDDALKILGEEDRPEFARTYDPRAQDWYKKAMAAPGQVKLEPHLLFSYRRVGASIATHMQNKRGVVGADILLDTLNEHLAQQKVTPNTQVVLAHPLGLVIAHENANRLIAAPEMSDATPRFTRIDELGSPVLSVLAKQIKTMPNTASTRRITMADGDWRVTIHPLQLEGAPPLFLINAMPESELLAAVLELRSTSILVTAFIILFAAPIAWSMARLVTRPLRALVFEAEAIRRFEFKNPIEVKSLVLEVHELGTTMADMKRTIHRFLDISRAVALEDNFDRLLPMLLKETLSAANADAGVLYLVDGEQLIPVAAMRGNDTFEERLASISTAAAGPLFSQAVQTGTSCSAELGATDIEIGGLGGLFANGAIKHGLAVPLLNRRQQLVGAMLLLRRTPIDSAQISFIKALTGSAATSLETRELIKAQKELFEALIHLIASAIDAKSHYTAGHCERVPEIAKLLARAACDDMSGVFKDFKLDDAEWESLHVAAWLHDCGKITTPEYVVDKATKLETIYDRIHEIRMRFEVLKRDAEIASLKAVANGADEERARALLVGELTQLDDDYRFVALCNEGGEFMAPDKVEHLRQIANRTWLRTLDDRLGLSHEERERKSYAQPSVLPAIEKLLADKPEHIIERRAQDRLIDNGKWGFRMETPPNLYNRGELYNLSISRGTLAEEERYKINEHIMQTLIMLSKLPFPKHLRQVPEIAGGHHEKMNGTGYPKRLTKDEMSVLARIMAIADIFEALTAVDRPYKKGKTLSETIKIMSFMAKDAHIDADLFALFLRSGAYLDYAEKYMQKEQIDTVDVERHLSI